MSLEELFKFGKLEKHKTSPQEIADLFGVAERSVKDAAQSAISLDLRFVSAYQAALAAGEALIHCAGYKAPKTNHHYMVWEALRQSLEPSFKGMLAVFDRARSRRAEAFYDRASVTNETELRELLRATEEFVTTMRRRIKKDFPELGGLI